MNASNHYSDMQRAGTGFMQTSSEALRMLEGLGYEANILPRFDHFKVAGQEKRIYPEDFRVDKMIRFENSSDPNDQSILYAISSPPNGIKGIYLESYGLYHDELSRSMIEKLCQHLQ